MVTFADWIKRSQPTIIQRSLNLPMGPDFISFALGLPATELLPIKLLRQDIQSTLNDGRFLQYSPPSNELKKQIVKLMQKRGVECSENQIFLTAGAQQGMSLLTRLLLNQGDTMILEDLIYTGFTQVLQPLHPNILTVSTSYDKGIDLDALEMTLKKVNKPAAIYIITNGHNPLGLNLDEDKKKKLIELIKEYKVPVIEDDAYGFLSYEHESLPLRALNDDLVIYLGSFSKIIAPSFRVGWIVGPEKLISKLSIVKEITDINTTTFTQGIISTFLEHGYFQEHVSMLKSEYRKRRDKMIQCLNTYFPKEISYHIPNNGMFIWVELPKVNAQQLLEVSIKMGVAFVPGNAFSVLTDSQASNCIRLNFSFCNEDKIEEGIKKLANAIDIVTSRQFKMAV